ncbi:methionine biosynthesis protein MetW [Endozoicomonas montiporae]|uniref:Methionine biosynthesis protein MetW n=2 Tax=Endozoicomonas montiporae TaxID=1027273 RepID=A0A081MZM6_9GAMM|nr:methionine biosynthesis protein MetW [Endozoicomonas montiporae]AMO54665.1 methionine biosynthesis protein MetW [Endozoicomonas montiporae CL-33]KEQ11649.1 methionine biosynthesis protein MetW [Endozoicomonas montiporae]
MSRRNDFDIIRQWIKPKSRVLDLACGDGELLRSLKQEKQVKGYGLEINPQNIERCIVNGINVLEQDIDRGLGNFRDGSFDTVVMTQALQVLRHPHLVMDEMLRVGRECIVTFPNFGHWRCRWYLSTRGKMPVSKFMPYTWYDTPNIHFCTFRDFEELCRQKQFTVIERLVVDNAHKGGWKTRLLPNLMGEIAIYHLTR